jgi:hypothetical protein
MLSKIETSDNHLYCTKISHPIPDVHLYGKLIIFFMKILLQINNVNLITITLQNIKAQTEERIL